MNLVDRFGKVSRYKINYNKLIILGMNTEQQLKED